MDVIKKLLVFSIVAFSLFVTTAAAPLQGQPPSAPIIRITQIDTSAFPTVKVYVSAIDNRGEPVPVNSAYLVLKENNKTMAVTSVQGIGEANRLTTMLVMDVSGSMDGGNKLRIAKIVAKEYVAQMGLTDQAGLMSFSDNAHYVQQVTSNHAALDNAIDSLKAKGNTAMYDTLLQAVQVLNPLPGRKAVIVLTDGLDNRSKGSVNDLLRAVSEKGLSISTVGMGEPNQSPGSSTEMDEATLNRLANLAGGRYGYANDQASLQALYSSLGRALRSEYVLTYNSPTNLRDGLSRVLSVSLAAGGGAPGGVNSGQTSYNPGGLVPEVGGAAPWGMFFTLLFLLLVLLFIPSGINLVRTRLLKTPAQQQGGRVKLAQAPKDARIKLK
jgi:Ca-activated chloride channel homolog